ncbi:hypothetical protein PMAA_017590 [Paecilomyces variotii No. 5]|uniref:C6 finger domain protein n=1 Tax=Byssochlamys spectabilis (strain No. 5 / NBRC 109023) TaxID=1356009 RepID=V5FIK2_BYSSN|nr:hypothetical protein PMAA_017590 [Paecilomyces variotii No. 5]
MFSVQSLPTSVGEQPASLTAYTKTFLLSSSTGALLDVPCISNNADPEENVCRTRNLEEAVRTAGDVESRYAISKTSQLDIHSNADLQCNEQVPCANCLHRREPCRRIRHLEGDSSIAVIPSAPILACSSTANISLTLKHFELFHHFRTQTINTLLIAPEAWRCVVQISFQFDFLMNALLAVSARHLSVLRRSDRSYCTVAASHLCRALSCLRHQVARHFYATNIDAFIATSLLLQIEVWANPDYFLSQVDDTSPFEPGDRLFAFSSSLKQVFLENVSQLPNEKSFFKEHIKHNPTDSLAKAAQINGATLTKYHDFFAYHNQLRGISLDLPIHYTRGQDLAISTPWHHVSDTVIHPTPDPIRDGYMPAITRLCLIQSYLPEAQPPVSAASDPSLLQELGRYILTFPVVSYGSFASMVDQSDPHAMLLLYHFYRAARKLLPGGDYWWAQARSSAMERVLRQRLHKMGLR